MTPINVPSQNVDPVTADHHHQRDSSHLPLAEVGQASREVYISFQGLFI